MAKRLLSSGWTKDDETGAILPPNGTLPGTPVGSDKSPTKPKSKKVGPPSKKPSKITDARGVTTQGEPAETREAAPPLPEQSERVKARVRNRQPKKKASPEARFAAQELRDRELDKHEDEAARAAGQPTPHRAKPGTRYSGSGPESGKLLSSTEYPIPTSRSDNAASRGVGTHTGGQGTSSTEQLHANILRRLASAPAHKVEAIKRELHSHVSTNGWTEGAPDVCQGPGCRTTIPYGDDADYCGGGSCTTAEATATPTPRAPK